MIYLALAHGATGISWWISPSPLEATLSQTALEVASFANRRLASLPAKAQWNDTANVHLAAWEHGDGGILVVAVNGRDIPATISLSGSWTGRKGQWQGVVGMAHNGMTLGLGAFGVNVAVWKSV